MKLTIYPAGFLARLQDELGHTRVWLTRVDISLSGADVIIRVRSKRSPDKYREWTIGALDNGARYGAYVGDTSVVKRLVDEITEFWAQEE